MSLLIDFNFKLFYQNLNLQPFSLLILKSIIYPTILSPIY